MRKIAVGTYIVLFGLLFGAMPAAAFNNNRYLAYGKLIQTPQAIKPQVLGTKAVSDAYIIGLVSDTVNKLAVLGALKGQKGDKGDPGQPGDSIGGSSVPDDGVTVAAPIAYNSNIPGNIAGFAELSAGDFTAGTSLTAASGPVEIAAAANLNVDGAANFTAPTTMASTTVSDLNVATIESGSGAFLSPGGTWTNASSRALKENFATVTPFTILDKIDSLPIYTWNYKKENPNVAHMGPVAEDFYASFGLGNSSSSISTIDPAGVALAGIQGLDAKLSSLLGISWILDGLKKLGLDIEQGFIKVESLVADMIQTKRLEVGSADEPTGITIYDTVTRQPVCIFSANGNLQSTPGECGTTNPATRPLASPANSVSQPMPTSTPDFLNSRDASSSASSTLAVLQPNPNLPQSTSTVPSAPAINAASPDSASSTPNN